jgi:hypothetical protein
MTPVSLKHERRVRVLASAYLAFGAFWALLAAVFFLPGGFDDSLGLAFVFWFTVAALPLLTAGWGLLRWKRWGRWFAMTLAAIALIVFPIGTAFGAYTLRVLWPAEAKALFH